MSERPPLTPEEEYFCYRTLELLRITTPDHPILNKRGYFGLFLSGLSAEEIGKDVHPSAAEFREMIGLLARAGVDRLQEILARSEPPQPPPPAKAPHAAPAPKLPSPAEAAPRAQTQRHLASVKPSLDQLDRLHHLPIAQTAEEAVELCRKYAGDNLHHDAHHIAAEYLATHGIHPHLLEVTCDVIAHGSQYDREAARAPFNLLWECEELAQILQKRIPDMSKLSPRADRNTAVLYYSARLVYHTWIDHARALLEYRYKVTNREYQHRSWIEPGDFGFLLDILRAAVRSKLPFDLLYDMYQRLRTCVAIGHLVIGKEEKRWKFEGDVIRILAGSVREAAPDVAFAMYRDIIAAYRREGDTANAMLFCKQALLIRRDDKELLQVKKELEQLR